MRWTAVALAGALVSLQDPVVQGPLKLVPSEVDLVVRIPSTPLLRQKLGRPPYSEVLKLKGVRDMLSGILGATGIDPLLLLTPVRGETLLIFPDLRAPQVVAVFDTGIPLIPYAAIVTRLFGEGWTREKETLEGYSVVRMTGPSVVYFCNVGAIVMVAQGREALRQVLARFKVPLGDAGLAEIQGLQAAMRRAGAGDAALLMNWARIRGRSALLRPLPSGWAAGTISFEPEALRVVLHLEEARPGELAGFFEAPRGAPIPGRVPADAHGVFGARLRWSRLLEAADSDRGDPGFRFAWEQVKAACGVDLRTGLVASLAPEAALFDRPGDPGLVGQIGWLDPAVGRRALDELVDSTRGELSVFAKAPRREGRLYRFEPVAVSAGDEGLGFGSAEPPVEAPADGPSWWAGAVRRAPPDAVVLHAATPSGWNRLLSEPGRWRSLAPSFRGIDYRFPSLPPPWSERLQALGGLSEKMDGWVLHCRVVDGGLRAEGALSWAR